MIKIKWNKLYSINIAQIILFISFFLWGFNFKSESNVISTNILGMLTKVQTTNTMQNFLWCFSHNLTIMFIVFWISYWTFGVVGTIWCVNNAFMLGGLIKLSLTSVNNPWLSVTFMILELLAAIILALTSTYFVLFKNRKKNYIYENEYEIEKKNRQKNVLITLGIIAIILLIAAIIETIVLSLIK